MPSTGLTPHSSSTIRFSPVGGNPHLKFDRALRDCFTDTLLLSPDGRTSPAHRIVLMAASKFFRRIFCSVTPANALASEYRLPVKHAIVKKILDVIYGHEVSVDTRMAKEFRDAVKFLELDYLIRERKKAPKRKAPSKSESEEAKSRSVSKHTKASSRHSEADHSLSSGDESESEEVEEKPRKVRDESESESESEAEAEAEEEKPLAKKPKKKAAPKNKKKRRTSTASSGVSEAEKCPSPPPPLMDSDLEDDEDLLETLWNRSTADATNFDRLAATSGEYSRLRQKIRAVPCDAGVYWRCKKCLFWSWKPEDTKKHVEKEHAIVYKV